VGALDGLIVEELDRLEKLIEIDRRKGLLPAIRSITATGGAATLRRAEGLTQDLLTEEDLRLAQQNEQYRRNTDPSVITAAVSTSFTLSLLAILTLLARGESRERRQAEEVVNFAATHAPLTGLPNRLLLAERVNRAVVQARSQGKSAALLFIDLDRFKNINDALGHEAGDRLLQNLADRLVR